MLLASELVWRGRIPFFAINSNRFDSPWIFEQDFTVSGQEKDIRIRTEKGPGRKAFRIYLNTLIKEKFVTRIVTKDKRAKYYSITPLGIIHLIKSEINHDGTKYPFPEQLKVILILQTFAQQNVKNYDSKIFEKERFFSIDVDVWEDLRNWKAFSLRSEIIHVFTNVSIEQQKKKNEEYWWNELEYFITNGYLENNKIHLMNANLIDEQNIQIQELDDYTLRSTSDKNKKLKLNLDQFHHYLANIMLCSLIYDYAIAEYDLINVRKEKGILKKWKKTKDQEIKKYFEELSHWPEYFIQILFLFSKHIERITSKQYSLTSSFHEKLNQIQFN